MVSKLILLVAIATTPFVAQAKGRWLTTSFIQAYLPADWNCQVKSKQWECKRSNPVKAREATILLSAKVAGPEDKLATYKRYLSHPINRPGSKRVRSKVLGVSEVTIHGQKWIDGYHSGSELKTWNSRYLATTKNGLAILVSLSSHSAKADEYKAIFSKIVSTFRVNIKKSVTTNIARSQTTQQPRQASPQPIPTSSDAPTVSSRFPTKYLIGFGLLLLAIITVLIIKRKK